MKRTVLLAIIIGIGTLALACTTSTPTTPTTNGALTTSAGLAQSAGLQKTGISGMINLVSVDAPERTLVTPSAVIHLFEMPEHTQYTGDIEGRVTFHASATRAQDGTHLIARGPVDGEVTFRGRTGQITGQWTTNCKWDAGLGNVSCGGIMNARGSGDLDGVQFHTEWGPGWWPFTYSGTAFSPR